MVWVNAKKKSTAILPGRPYALSPISEKLSLYFFLISSNLSEAIMVNIQLKSRAHEENNHPPFTQPLGRNSTPVATNPLMRVKNVERGPILPVCFSSASLLSLRLV
jgi:hypothetical protein